MKKVSIIFFVFCFLSVLSANSIALISPPDPIEKIDAKDGITAFKTSYAGKEKLKFVNSSGSVITISTTEYEVYDFTDLTCALAGKSVLVDFDDFVVINENLVAYQDEVGTLICTVQDVVVDEGSSVVDEGDLTDTSMSGGAYDGDETLAPASVYHVEDSDYRIKFYNVRTGTETTILTTSNKPDFIIDNDPEICWYNDLGYDLSCYDTSTGSTRTRTFSAEIRGMAMSGSGTVVQLYSGGGSSGYAVDYFNDVWTDSGVSVLSGSPDAAWAILMSLKTGTSSDSHYFHWYNYSTNKLFMMTRMVTTEEIPYSGNLRGTALNVYSEAAIVAGSGKIPETLGPKLGALIKLTHPRTAFITLSGSEYIVQFWDGKDDSTTEVYRSTDAIEYVQFDGDNIYWLEADSTIKKYDVSSGATDTVYQNSIKLPMQLPLPFTGFH